MNPYVYKTWLGVKPFRLSSDRTDCLLSGVCPMSLCLVAARAEYKQRHTITAVPGAFLTHCVAPVIVFTSLPKQTKAPQTGPEFMAHPSSP